ncbi:MAG TPA: hypothetical protein VNG13_13590 [Mycobacteriales bacterium]|nr:hypothetical protein [Mycobacteriales bacterium]
MTLRRRVLWLALLTLSASGCAVSNLSFVADKRLTVTSPKAQQLVGLPVTLRWTIKDFTISAPNSAAASATSGYFAIFVDRAPIRPGQTLKAVGSGDPACVHTPGCPDTTYLADHQVYTTTATSLTLTSVNSLNTYQQVQLHEAIIVLLDASGHRIGESAWYVDFRVRQLGVS